MHNAYLSSFFGLCVNLRGHVVAHPRRTTKSPPLADDPNRTFVSRRRQEGGLPSFVIQPGGDVDVELDKEPRTWRRWNRRDACPLPSGSRVGRLNDARRAPCRDPRERRGSLCALICRRCRRSL